MGRTERDPVRGPVRNAVRNAVPGRAFGRTLLFAAALGWAAFGLHAAPFGKALDAARDAAGGAPAAPGWLLDFYDDPFWEGPGRGTDLVPHPDGLASGYASDGARGTDGRDPA